MLVPLDTVADFQGTHILRIMVPPDVPEDEVEAGLVQAVCEFRNQGADCGMFLSSDDVSVLDVECYADGMREFILGWRPDIVDTHVLLVGGSLHGSIVYCVDILNPLHYLVEGQVERYALTGWNDGLHRWQFEFEAPTPLV